VFACSVRLLGSQLNTVPLECVTRDELTLIAYIHGHEALADVRYLGQRQVPTFNPDEGAPEFVGSQDAEYRRLARKYDTIVNSGRGKAAVEKCFNVQLIDFDAVVSAVSAADEAERMAAEAEAKSLISAAGEQRESEIKREPEAKPPSGGLGAAIASTFAGRQE
jgi:hypothetical protein